MAKTDADIWKKNITIQGAGLLFVKGKLLSSNSCPDCMNTRLIKVSNKINTIHPLKRLVISLLRLLLFPKIEPSKKHKFFMNNCTSKIREKINKDVTLSKIANDVDHKTIQISG